MQVEIDPHSGFCGGVIRAIGTAEEILAKGGADNLEDAFVSIAEKEGIA